MRHGTKTMKNLLEKCCSLFKLMNARVYVREVGNAQIALAVYSARITHGPECFTISNRDRLI